MSTERCPHCGAMAGKRISTLRGFLIILVGVPVFLLTLFLVERVAHYRPSAGKGPYVLSEKEKVLNMINLDFTMDSNISGDVLEGDFVIRNHSHRAIRNIELLCQHDATSRVLLEDIVEAYSERRFRSIAMKPAPNSKAWNRCQIINLDIE